MARDKDAEANEMLETGNGKKKNGNKNGHANGEALISNGQNKDNKDPADEKVDLRYGWGKFKAPCLQFFNKACWLLLFISLGNAVQVSRIL